MDRRSRSATPAPDPGSAEAARAKVATEPVGVAGSDQVQVRVSATKADARLDRLEATFVDGGTSAADATVGRDAGRHRRGRGREADHHQPRPVGRRREPAHLQP